MVVLVWTKSKDQVDYYQIRYKSKDGQEMWKIAETDAAQKQTTISKLMANTVCTILYFKLEEYSKTKRAVTVLLMMMLKLLNL